MSASPHQAESVLRRLEWTVVRRLDGLLQGDYRTLFRGMGLDLADLRAYQAHDDVRHIDWNVTARTGEPHVRVYNEERELTAWFLLDLSPSVDFGSGEISKRQVLAEFTAVLARLLTRRGNMAGAILFNGIDEFVVPPRGGRRHVLHLLAKVLTHPRLLRAPETDLGAFLGRSLKALKRRSLVFVLSDFISRPGWERALAELSRHHEVVAVRLFDPLEGALPNLGMMLIEDAESGEQLFVDTADRGFRRRFLAEAERREAALYDAFGRAGTDVLELSTADDLLDAILRFADLRRMGAGLGGGLPGRLSQNSTGAGI
ncbi:DUF58 domain-containing protein [Pleomorphomonas diazotrophica]|uniref:DUF58 domain-containing protein n=1 Tax=Pleomorphomonas diazotrophica TaxID=1166257 RepID=A0A1I4UMS5_9HYPH|nr:DUF58 domain-containing protein [Pleomorphomonas diazotrophica]PKR88352.1 DUF58 domain-containing protein [Pleomorphomonas diazotrophica]SFM90304.1 Protein of unknown function DUF58 [Pleomorphomonas diazotrophica]